MKISSLITLAFLLAGCESSRQSASLSAEQAATQAIRLANDKAFTLYHGRPFQPGQPAQFVAGHWIWSDRRGFGQGDIEASVELAVDGGPQKVEVTWFSNEQGFIQAGISIPTTNADLSPSVLMQFYFVGDRMNSRAYTRLPR